jgi:O-antigen chain-terminating methyltransferase
VANARKQKIEKEQISGRLKETEAQLASARADIDAESARAKHLDARLAEVRSVYAAERDQLHAEKNDLQSRLNESLGNAHHWWLTATAHEQALNALESSWSWRLTWPLRKAFDVIRWLLLLPIRLVAAVSGPILRSAMAFVLGRPRLRQFVSNILQKLPFLYWPLFKMGDKAGLPVTAQRASPSEHYSSPERVEKQSLKVASTESTEPDLNSLTPRAREIYANLKAAIKERKDKAA